jgi:hypothetical protein
VASIVEAEKPFVTELLFEGIIPELHSRAEESNEPDINRSDMPASEVATSRLEAENAFVADSTPDAEKAWVAINVRHE